METQWKQGIRALVDCGATGLFIDREYVKSNRLPTRKLSRSIPVFNVDGTANEAGSISEVVELIIQYDGHSERALFSVTSLGRQNMILGITWLREHNPEIDWRTGKVEMTRCLLRCCVGCRNELRTERRNSKKEEVSINACRTGPFPEPSEESSDEELPASDLPFDLEDGDHVWATGLLPEAQYIQATSTISQQNLEYFMSAKKLNRRQARWSLTLAWFDFVMHHRPGKTMGKPDALSRRADHGSGGEDNRDITLLTPSFFTVRALEGTEVEGEERDLLRAIRRETRDGELEDIVGKAVKALKSSSARSIRSSEWSEVEGILHF
jgi:predicted aspartyl protease